MLALYKISIVKHSTFLLHIRQIKLDEVRPVAGTPWIGPAESPEKKAQGKSLE